MSDMVLHQILCDFGEDCEAEPPFISSDLRVTREQAAKAGWTRGPERRGLLPDSLAGGGPLMTSRRTQKRDGTRKGRQGDEHLREYVMREYEAVREAWLADRSPFRPVHPPLPPVVFTAPVSTVTEEER